MISRRKLQYPVSSPLRQYLYRFDRLRDIPQVYWELCRFTGAVPYEDPRGRETLWLTVMYPPDVFAELRTRLTSIYTELKLGRDVTQHEHLLVDRVDFGDFGNSKPFRVRITNVFNDNSDYFYVKQADASRIYGLELEHILSPTRINYIVNGTTLIEEHIAGVPGEVQYRVRPIDFDEQSYEGRGNTYLALRFSSNRAITRLAFDVLNRKTIDQYVAEEYAQMSRRAKVESSRLRALLGIMSREELAPHAHVVSLAMELDRIHHTSTFAHCQSMGELTAKHLSLMLDM